MALQYEVEQFLYAEAALLDGRRFREWLALFTEDVRYWAPVRVTREGRPDVAGEGELCLLDDNAEFLQLRVEGLQLRSAWAEIPPSRTRHLISNVRVVEAGEDGGLEVSSYFHVFRARGETTEHSWIGERRDRLVRDGAGALRIRERCIKFDSVTLQTDNLSVLI